jgi:rod shape-determining protein MreC
VARRNPLRDRPFAVLGVLVLAWLLLPPTVQRFAGTAFSEFQAPAAEGVARIRDLGSYWSLRTLSRRELIETGRELSRLNALYRLQAGETEALRQYNARLRALLDLPEPPGFRREVARVTGRDLTNWWQTVTIRKGRQAGIRPGHGVVFAGGVAGRVREVFSGTARVELVTSPGFRMAARFAGDRRPVRYEGRPVGLLRDPQGQVRDVPSDFYASPEEPLELVSSRLGGVFPDGLPLGTVERLATGPSGLFQTGPVLLDPELLTLEEVAVLVPEETGEDAEEPRR